MQTLSRVEDLVAACDERQIGDKLRVNKSLPGPLTTFVKTNFGGCYTSLFIFNLVDLPAHVSLKTGYDACAGDCETWKLDTRCLCHTARN